MSQDGTSVKRVIAISLITAILAFAFRTFSFSLYVIPSSSMVPTLLTGDYILANKHVYGFSGVGTLGGLIKTVGRLGGILPKRGDVVLFKSPEDNATVLIKRLIGLPGDTIQMYRSQLYINGKLVPREQLAVPMAFPGDDEPTGNYVDYIEQLPNAMPHIIRLIRELETEETVNNTPPLTVPPYTYFFMGDNRDRSDDSRVSDVGFVPEENLVGRAEITFFSMSPSVGFFEFSKWSWAVRWPRLLRKIS